MSNTTPKGWKVIPAEEYCNEVTDGTHDSPKAVDNNGYYLLTSKNITSGILNYDNAYCISEEDFNNVNKRSKVRQYDLLYSMIGTVGESCIVEQENVDFAIKNVGLFRLGGDILKAKWLNYFFKTRLAKNYVEKSLKGATQKYIALGILRKFPIFIPNTQEEQEEIIKVLDAMSEVIRLREECIEHAQDLIPALFQEMFGNPLTNDKNLPIVRIDSVTKVVSGGTPSTQNPEYWDGDIIWLTPKDLSGYKSVYISKGERNITELGYQKSSAQRMPKGSVLFTSRAPIGYVAIAEVNLCTNQGFKSFVPTEAIKSEYLYQLLKMSKEKIINMASGATFKEISGSRIKELKIPIAPIELQEQFAEKVKEINSYIEEQEQERENAEQMFQSLLHHAFTGELTRRAYGKD